LRHDPEELTAMATAAATTTAVSVSRTEDQILVIRLAGSWQLESGFPPLDEVERELASGWKPSGVAFDTKDLGTWDSGVLAFLATTSKLARQRGIPVDRSGLPKGLARLLALAEAVPEKKDAASDDDLDDPFFLQRIGARAIHTQLMFRSGLSFVGQLVIAFGRMLRGRARLRWSDVALLVQQSGIEALPIVTLVTFLLGLILAFVGAIQLQTFGATIYVADLVGVAMVRDMGALITGIIMAGRSGAAFAAQIGSMKVTQEIDALETMAIPTMDFLVLPRVIALFLMMPLLTLYGDAMGILGGAFVGVTMLGLSPISYLLQTADAVSMTHAIGGVIKGTVYGVLIAIAGCLQGVQSGKSSSAVGDAATKAVVTGIVSIITACGLFAFLFYALGI
jgi:phospholipid/cholesterol/gamma-HCH transport system permease protein